MRNPNYFLDQLPFVAPDNMGETHPEFEEIKTEPLPAWTPPTDPHCYHCDLRNEDIGRLKEREKMADDLSPLYERVGFYKGLLAGLLVGQLVPILFLALFQLFTR
jgi:hypothetical protein